MSREHLKYQGKNVLLKHIESPWISILINLIWIKHRYQEICIGSPLYFVDISKGVIHIDKGLYLFKLSAQIHSS
jgi:hypothetical protein